MTRIEAQGPAMGLFRDPHVARLTDQVPLLSRQVQRLHQLIERLAARQGITPPPPVVAGPCRSSGPTRRAGPATEARDLVESWWVRPPRGSARR